MNQNNITDLPTEYRQKLKFAQFLVQNTMSPVDHTQQSYVIYLFMRVMRESGDKFLKRCYRPTDIQNEQYHLFQY